MNKFLVLPLLLFISSSVCSFKSASEPESLPVYDKYLTKTTNTSNFVSLKTKVFENINNKDVTVDYFNYLPNNPLNNPNVGEGILIKECIDYKIKHPEQDVSIHISSFHFSTFTAVNLDRNSKYFGNLIPLVDKEFDEYGFYRISYLLVEAAKYGIHTTIINQIPAYYFEYEEGKFIQDEDPQTYFPKHYDDDCYFDIGAKASKYFHYTHCDWKSYDDKSAVDMMHFKCCAVSNYIDELTNKEYGKSTWLSSVNLDSVLFNGVNANNAQQSGFIISNHNEIYDVCINYLDLMKTMCKQEQAYDFRELIKVVVKEQIDTYSDNINADERLVYLGSSLDDVFEMYVTPLCGGIGSYNEIYNPICKYISDMCDSTSYIEYGISNVKFNHDFSFADIMLCKVSNFVKNKYPSIFNQVYLNAPLDEVAMNIFKDIAIGSDVGLLKNSINYGLHNKDFILSYVKNSARKYITINTSSNFHLGAFFHQSNHALIIKEETNHELYDSFKQNTFNNFQ